MYKLRTACAVVAGVAVSGLLSQTVANAGPAPVTPTPTVVTSTSELSSLPMSGAGWSAMLKVANSSLGPVALADQNNMTSGRTVSAALVFARTGNATYYNKVVAVLRQVPTSPLATAKVLSISRQLGGYAISADLVGYRDPTFVTFMSGIRTRYIGNHSRFTALNQTSDNTSNNWGAWSTTSRVAIDRYLGDTTDLAKAAQVFKGFTGDRTAHTFAKTADFDPTWACDPVNWQPINPASCGDRSGAFVEDISRSDGTYPTITSAGTMYSWEVMSASMLTARMLYRAGYTTVYQWGDNALLRAAQFLQRTGGFPPPYSTNQYTPYLINRVYGTGFGPLQAAGTGRQFGNTDWLQ